MEQCRLGCNGNEGVLYTSQIKTGASPSDDLVSYLGHSFGVGGLTQKMRWLTDFNENVI